VLSAELTLSGTTGAGELDIESASSEIPEATG
jgi:hypothetical protein